MPGMVIVGAGECGVRAAFALRQAGWTGPITLVGAENAVPYERPPLSKSVLTQEVNPPTICDAEALCDADIDFRCGITATDIDCAAHELVLADGRRIGYRRLLLATGATARRLPLTGTATDALYYLRNRPDALALRARLRPGAHIGVIGGGFLGLELAASASTRGCTVTVIETAPRLMGRVVPAEIADVVAARHQQAGVIVRCQTGVVDLRRHGQQLLVTLTTGDTITCDTIVASVGAVPDTALADKAGLALDTGIRVDDRLTTSDPDIFAAGDCCSFPHPLYHHQRIRLESWRNAHDQGTTAARNMLGADEPYQTVPWFWSDQYDLTLQIAGLPGTASTHVVRRRPDNVDIHFGLAAGPRLLAASAIGTGNTVAKDIRLAEMLIARRAGPHPSALADPTINLKTLLRGA